MLRIVSKEDGTPSSIFKYHYAFLTIGDQLQREPWNVEEDAPLEVTKKTWIQFWK